MDANIDTTVSVNETITKPAQVASMAAFMKGNVKLPENVKYAATDRITDPSTGKPVEWEIKALPSGTIAKLREKCSRMVKLPTKKTYYTQMTDQEKYMEALAVTSTVFPDLNDATLQDSYGVIGAEALLHALLCVGGEYDDYAAKVAEVNGYEPDMDELKDNAKN
jgi:hypothetical protein